MNGYEERIVQQCTKSAYLNKRSIKSTIVNLLYKEITYNKKSQAIAVLDKVGDRFYTEETYERAAEMLLAKRDNVARGTLCECMGNERVALDCTMKPCKHPKYFKGEQAT